MRSFVINPRLSPLILSVCAAMFCLAHAHAGDSHGKNGSVILRMCKGADKVKTLSVMCHSYLDGYLEAAHQYGKGKAEFCLGSADKQQAPKALVAWIDAHPESLSRPAGEVLQQALAERFPCKAGK